MVKSAESVVVARSAGDVFRYVADLRNEPNWHVDIASVPPETDPVPVVGKTSLWGRVSRAWFLDCGHG